MYLGFDIGGTKSAVILGASGTTGERLIIEPAMMEVIKAEAIPDSGRACKIVPAGLGESIGDIAALSLAAMAE
jgi:glucokinase